MSQGIIQAFREMDEPSYMASETPGVHRNMVRCALFPEMEFSDRDELTCVLTGWNQADEHRLRGLIWTLRKLVSGIGIREYFQATSH